MLHEVNDALKPPLVGLAAGLLSVALPSGLGLVIIIAAAFLAGWLLPTQPMTAAALFLAPAIVIGTIVVLADDASNVGSLFLGFVGVVLFTAIFTHVGAGIALRRSMDVDPR